MALLAQLNSIGISDPDGWQIALAVSFMDDQIVDPKSGAATIVASKTFLLDPTATKQDVYDAIASYGKRVQSSRASAAQFAAQYPAGTSITIS